MLDRHLNQQNGDHQDSGEDSGESVMEGSRHSTARMSASRRRSASRPAVALLCLSALLVCAALPASAQLTFNFNYTDAPGVGFNAADPLGADRRNALAQTATLLSSFFPGLTATINMSVNGSETDDSTLAAAGSNYSSTAASTCAAGYNRGDVGTIALGGADPNAGLADGTVTVNFQDVMWDLDDSVSAGLFDFKSTMLHELLHAMGFSHSVAQNGNDACSTTPGNAGGWVPYDEHLGNTTANFINVSFILDGAAWGAAVTGGTGPANGVLWRGPTAMASNGGNPVPLYSPTTYSGGSSIAHLDDDFFVRRGSPPSTLLMEAATVAGPGVRTLHPIEQGIMRDIGFTSTVPVELQSFSVE